MDMRFGTWNVRNLYLLGYLKTISRELTKYKLDLVGVHGTWVALNQQMIIHSSVEMRMLISSQGQTFFVHKGIVSAVKMVEFVSDRMSKKAVDGYYSSD
jgi:hypothetical protein